MINNKNKFKATIDLLNEKDFLFFNSRFDKQESFFVTKNDDTISIYNKNNNIFVSEDSLITYRFNSDGFRGDNFKQLNGINILAAGCSNTFGVGLPEEMNWPNLLNDVFFNKNIYNIGYMGFTTEIIIHNIFVFLNKYGVPNYLFLNLPPINRTLFYNDDSDSIGMTHNPLFFTNNKNFIEIFNKDDSKLFNLFINNCILIHSLENICDVLGIKFRWFSWDLFSQNAYSKVNFKYFIDDSKFSNIKNEEKNKYCLDGKYEISADDGYHPGTLQNFIWAKTFFNNV